jgi:glycosyltransferase involved in cell wall biosynthesis
MTSGMSLSVVLPNYNHAKYLPAALEAILSQQYLPREIIILDDASTDNSLEILNSFKNKCSLIRIIKNEHNLGAVCSANRLLECATGEYIYFGAADDLILPGLFEKSMRMLADYPEAGLCSSLARLIDESGHDIELYQSRIVSRQTRFIPIEECRSILEKHGGWFVGSTTIFKKKALIEAGGFNPDFGPFVDGFTQQVIALRDGVCFIPEPLACWRILSSGYSQKTRLNIEQNFQFLSKITHEMTTTYHDLFTPKYTKKYRREILFRIGLAADDNLKIAQSVYLDYLNRIFSPIGVCDHIYLKFLECSMCIQSWLTKGYLWLRLRSFTLEMFYRRITWFFEHMRMLVKKR